MQLNEAVAERIKELCKENGLTQYQLYLKSGVQRFNQQKFKKPIDTVVQSYNCVGLFFN